MNTNPFITILHSIHTIGEAEQLASTVDVLMANLYKVQQTQPLDILSATLPARITDAIKQTLAQQQLNWQDHAQVQAFFSNLTNALQQTKILNLSLAIEPTEDIISAIHSWVSMNIPDPVFLKFHYNPSLLGGTVITYKGLYLDYSVQTRLQKVFKERRDEIVKLWK